LLVLESRNEALCLEQRSNYQITHYNIATRTTGFG